MASVPTPTSTFEVISLPSREAVAAPVARTPRLSLDPDRPIRVGSPRPVVNRFDRIVRRSFDILVSASALLLLTPLFALVAILVKLTSKGPILYSQVRVGQNRRVGDRRSSPTNHSGPRDRRDEHEIHPRNDFRASATVGGSTGFLAGLLGIGGGPVAAPLLNRVCLLPVREAVGTSLGIVCLTSIVGAARKNATIAGLTDSAGNSLGLGISRGNVRIPRIMLLKTNRTVKLLVKRKDCIMSWDHSLRYQE